MKTQYFYLEIVAVLLIYVIPWPGPSVFKISCPRDSTSMVRRIVQKKWIPVLKKYRVDLPLDCPFHKTRDIFHPQQAAKKQHRSSQWTCGLCGKSFYEEKDLDLHFDNRHKNNINMAEDAVCLADYCDIMRCDVLMTQDFEGSLDDDSGPLNTDIEVWRETTPSHTTIAPSGSKELARIYHEKFQGSGSTSWHFQHHCQPHDKPDNRFTSYHRKPQINGSDNKTNDICDNDHLVNSALPAIDRKQQRLFELQKLKSNCKPEELLKLKLRCEALIRDCIAGLLVNLSTQDFNDVEGELNRAICWYLSCDKYWEDTKRQKLQITWKILAYLGLLMSLPTYICYYVIWVLFDSVDEISADGIAEILSTRESSNDMTCPLHNSNLGKKKDGKGKLGIAQDTPPASADMPDHCIYVAYPPELRRRLLESCYNRTTRL